jgi:hypothetical protein
MFLQIAAFRNSPIVRQSSRKDGINHFMTALVHFAFSHGLAFESLRYATQHYQSDVTSWGEPPRTFLASKPLNVKISFERSGICDHSRRCDSQFQLTDTINY